MPDMPAAGAAALPGVIMGPNDVPTKDDWLARRGKTPWCGRPRSSADRPGKGEP